ncbi:MAG: GNAT family N-acetyltransferase [Verrucomicrobiae bacterium]|nr:GNAT family N-acetyltransferase [Verrucomicrobiae bacterium]
MSSSALRLRNLTAADIPFATRLKSIAGWNQMEADWRRFIELEPDVCFVAEYEGRPAGTVTAIRFEERFGWIGMMLVDPDRRRLGIASALLQHAMDYLTVRKVETIKLDATPAGKTVYDQHGFKDEYLIERGLRPASPSAMIVPHCSRVLPRDLDTVAEFDAEIFGADRRSLLATLLRDAPEYCFQTDGGFVMGRRGTTAAQIGPLVARNTAAAERLLANVLRSVGNSPVILDVPMCNQAAVALSARVGFQKQRELIRQVRGTNRFPGDLQQIFGITDTELG